MVKKRCQTLEIVKHVKVDVERRDFERVKEGRIWSSVLMMPRIDTCERVKCYVNVQATQTWKADLKR